MILSISTPKVLQSSDKNSYTSYFIRYPSLLLLDILNYIEVDQVYKIAVTSLFPFKNGRSTTCVSILVIPSLKCHTWAGLYQMTRRNWWDSQTQSHQQICPVYKNVMSVVRETKASETNKDTDKNVSMPNRVLTLKRIWSSLFWVKYFCS